MADPLGPQALDYLADLVDPVLAALLADVDRDAEARGARGLDERLEVAVGIGAGVGARAAMSTPTMPRFA